MTGVLHDREAARLNELRRYQILDTDPEAAFERIAKLAQHMFNVPIVQINFIDKARQWPKASLGLELCDTDLEASFCAHTIQQDDVMVVLDATRDTRLRDTRLVTNSPFIRFYAGAPLTTPQGHNLGALCLVDTVAHEHFGKEAQAILTEFAAMVVDVLELRLADQGVRTQEARHHIVSESTSDAIVTIDKESTVLYLNPAERALAESEARYRAIVEQATVGVSQTDLTGRFLYVNNRYCEIVGRSCEVLLGGLRLHDVTDPEDLPQNLQSFDSLSDDGSPFSIEKRYVRPGGTRVWVGLEVSLVRDAQGKPLYVQAIVQDITERKRAERALAESEARYRIVAETASDVLVTIDESSTILYLNPAAEKTFGYPLEEMLGQSLTMLMSKYLRHVHEAGLKRYRETGRRHISWAAVEVPGLHKDGHEIDLEVSFGEHQQGEQRHFTAIIRDVTERKRASDALRRTTALLQGTFDSTAEGVLSVNEHGHVTNYNRRYLEMWRVPKEVLDSGHDDALVQHALQQLKEPDGFIERVQEAYKNIEGETRDEFELRDGRIIERVSLPQRVESRFVGRVWCFRDVTERKHAEEKARALHASEREAWLEVEQANNRLTFLAEASHILSSSLDYEATLRRAAELAVPDMADWCAVDILTADGKLERLATTHENPEKVRWALELYSRYPPNPNTPRGVYHVVSTGQPEFYQTIPDELLEKAAWDSEHLELLRAVGFSSAIIVPLNAREQMFGALTLVYAGSAKRYREEDLRLAQELAGRAAVAIENAQLYQQAQELNETLESRVRQRTEQLEAANRELEAFSYSVSHDLRAPLRGIDGFSQALEEDYAQELDGAAKRYLERIRTGTQRMGRLIDDLLNLSRLFRTEVRWQTVDLTSVAEGIADELSSRQPDRQVTFTVVKEMVAKGDERLLGIVLQNLLENAWKFTAKCDQACIEVGRRLADEAQTTYFVKDNGAGFDMAYADKLFGAFQRLHSPSEFEGTGIGLATVQRIILRHGGRVWAESEVGKGATFYFTLAVEEGEVEEHDPR